ncbi:DUF3050 domain-containing protein [Seonamhaeicola sp. ML3]|uniref:DUF3050 domain-containing protein n=1 Tax=Seonamhaeicola sp. ML3 TaxID=2937786 RepID=UPI00200E8285|nr:DUF3050 domain-containing protein [Seonamhaeicola sp. ML3]
MEKKAKIELIHEELKGLKMTLKNHPVYSMLDDVNNVKIFMENHVFSVWDFMSILKGLQTNLTNIVVPWKPLSNAKTVRFINELVLAEESDIGNKSTPLSHYEMYIEAMLEVGADTTKILRFVNGVSDMNSIHAHINKSKLRNWLKSFLNFTFNVINTNEIHKIAAIFTFGREDLLPDIFLHVLDKIKRQRGVSYPKFQYYLERHVELDGDFHGPIAIELLSELCGSSDKKWDEALEVSKQALIKRVELWDGILYEINLTKKKCSY